MSELQTNSKNRCRICLDTDGGHVLLNSNVCVDDQQMMISDMLISCTGLYISANDEKPQSICLQCSATTYNLYQFRVICIKTDVILQNELDSQNGLNLQENKLDLHSELDLAIDESKANVIKDDNKNGTMAPIKNEFPDFITLSNTYDLNQFKFEQNTSTVEEIICKFCQTYFTNWKGLEHHLENCYMRVCNDGGQTFRSDDTLNGQALTREATSTCKNVVLKQRKKLESHICRFCKMSYKFPVELRNHLMTHTTVKRHLCSYCGINFKLSDCSKCLRTQSRHGHEHIKKKRSNKASVSLKTRQRYSCSLCKKLYCSKKSLMTHKCINSIKDLHKCSQCSKMFNYSYKLKQHTSLAHPVEKPYGCSHCSKRFTQRSNLSTHKLIHTGKKLYECSHCSKRFRQVGTLANHELTHTGEKPFGCSECSKRFTHIHQLNRHKRTHTGEKPFECSHCGKCFADLSGITRHERTHTGEKPYKCSSCGRRFADKLALTRHKKKHTGETPYACSHCSKRFTEQSYLCTHEKIHTGEGLYQCPHCSKSFTDRSNFARHARIHTGVKPYQCSYCSRCFTDKSNCTNHERTHTGEKPFKCSHCSRSFTKRCHLTKHERYYCAEKPFKFLDCS